MGLRLSAAGIFLLGAAGLLLHSTLLETGHIRPGMFCFTLISAICWCWCMGWPWRRRRRGRCGGC